MEETYIERAKNKTLKRKIMISIDPHVLKDIKKILGSKGVKLSPFIEIILSDFVDGYVAGKVHRTHDKEKCTFCRSKKDVEGAK